jgi:L-malate glycosyltransferase
MYQLIIIKRQLEGLFIYPFILIGRFIALLNPLKKKYTTFFFFPFYHTGGAEKVHAQITQAAGGSDCIIFFTKKSVNNSFLAEFKKSGATIKDISKYTDNKFLYFLNLIYRGIVTAYINHQPGSSVVFNGQCNFGYKISPWIHTKNRQIELIHSFNSFSYIRIPFLSFIDQTVMISKKRIEDHLSFYQKTGIPNGYNKKIRYIPNAIHLPELVEEKQTTELSVLYVGRGGKEKRIHLIAEIARRLTQINQPVKFYFLGDVSDVLDKAKYPYIHFYGNQDDKEIIHSAYSKANILILTSSTEGFPMVVIEAMANSCAILATPVGDIPYHITNGKNGFLFSSTDNEDTIIKEGVEYIQLLSHQPRQLDLICKTNIQYAADHFGIEKFNAAYNELLKAKNIETA